ncbi:MAG: DUF2225 domain-containing protein [Treponema sp.]|jgi:uncharacterized protein (DUF2225 family)|nr:DUF2225 domain-containing protein [Treponema sp.]
MRIKEKKPEKLLATTFYSKQKQKCPVCKTEFEKEELLSGGGRLIAGPLTDELRRTYEPSAKYGKIYPQIYAIAACPKCHCAMLWSDLNFLDNKETINNLLNDEEKRKKSVAEVFPHYNFSRNRTLLDGAAAYYHALLCYEKFPTNMSPTIKKAQICLRLAWLCNDINTESPHRGYDYIAQVFYRKAMFFYQESLILEMKHIETLSALTNLGPDTDKNYGYDGLIYLCGLLEYKYGQHEDKNLRFKKLDEYKRAIARSFGLGKTSKNKPGPLLEHSRELYDNINNEIKDAHNIDIDIDLSDD